MELFEEIRREYEFGVGTIQGVARKFGVHRRMVREALGSAIPAGILLFLGAATVTATSGLFDMVIPTGADTAGWLPPARRPPQAGGTRYRQPHGHHFARWRFGEDRWTIGRVPIAGLRHSREPHST